MAKLNQVDAADKTPFFPAEMPAHAQELAELEKKFKVRARLIKNQTRGRIGEIMATTIVDRKYRDEARIDNKVFRAPEKIRRIDCFYERDLLAIESKFTYVYATKFVREQIKKDAYLLQSGQCREIIWVIYKGASKKALELLGQHGITVKVGWDNIIPENNSDA